MFNGMKTEFLILHFPVGFDRELELQELIDKFIAKGIIVDRRFGVDPSMALHFSQLRVEWNRRIKVGVDRARREGKRLGRPPCSAELLITPIRELRAAGVSWHRIPEALFSATDIKISSRTARRIYEDFLRQTDEECLTEQDKKELECLKKAKRYTKGVRMLCKALSA